MPSKSRPAPSKPVGIPAAKGRSTCPIACALDLIGDRWTLLVIRDMLCGRSRFRDFLASPERISTNILADRLERLVESGLAYREPSPERRGADEYHLTPEGRNLLGVLEEIRAWGLSSIPGTEARISLKA